MKKTIKNRFLFSPVIGLLILASGFSGLSGFLGSHAAFAAEIDDPASAQELAAMLPIRTPELTAQKFESYALPSPEVISVTLSQPICVVGEDAFSLQWLQERKAKLIEMGAICFVVNIEKSEIWFAMHREFADLVLVPANGAWLTQYYKLQHYPALINKQGVFQ